MNKKELTEEQKQALETFKKTKDDPDTFAGFFYSVLKDANPVFREHMERQAAVLLHAGNKIGQEIAGSEKDPKKRAEMRKKLQQMALKIRSSVYESGKNEKEDKEGG